MKIIRAVGKKWPGDIIFFIKSNEEEALAMDRLLVLVNQFAFNEFNGYKERGYLERELPFYFGDAVLEVIELGKKGVDLTDAKNDSIAEELCEKYGLEYTRWKQTILKEFKGGDVHA